MAILLNESITTIINYHVENKKYLLWGFGMVDQIPVEVLIEFGQRVIAG